jgi:hypothetical protein
MVRQKTISSKRQEINSGDPKVSVQSLSLREAIANLREEIKLVLARGYSYVEVAELLTSQGIKVTDCSLKQYLELVEKKPLNEGYDNSLPAVENDPIWEMGSNPICMGILDASENHDVYLYQIS